MFKESMGLFGGGWAMTSLAPQKMMMWILSAARVDNEDIQA
jgi:hypothetical protein